MITASYNPNGLTEILLVEGHSGEKVSGEQFAILCASVSTVLEFTEFMLSRLNIYGPKFCTFEKRDGGYHRIVIDKPTEFWENEKVVETWLRAQFILFSAALSLQGLSQDHPKLIQYKKPGVSRKEG